MTFRHPFPRALVAATATAVLLLPAAASASPDAHWSPQLQASEDGHSVLSPNIAVAPNGAATIVWRKNDGGSQTLVAATREPGAASFGAPVPISADGEDASEPVVKSDLNGDVTVAWVPASGTAVVHVRTLDAQTHTWDAQVTELNPGNNGANGYTLKANPDRTLTAVWGSYIASENANALVMRTRSAAGTWSTARFVLTDSGNVDQPDVQFNADGDGIAVWRSFNSGVVDLRVARYSHESDEWTLNPQPLDTDQDTIENVHVAIDDDGNAVAVWYTGNGFALHTKHADLDAATGQWSSPDSLLAAQPAAGHENDVAILPGVAYDQRGKFVVTFQALTPDNDQYTAFASSYPQARTYDPATKTWTEPVLPGGATRGGAPELAVNANGDMVLTMIGTVDLQNPSVIVTTRAAGADAFTPAQAVSEGVFNPWAGGLPHGGVDEAGNAYAAYPIDTGGSVVAALRVGDFSGPALSGVAFPSAGTVGQSLSFSASALDALSSLGTMTWNFGDGDTANGSSVTHIYAAAGSYTVTVTATDAVGNTSSQSATVTVSAAEKPKVDPPKVDPPKVDPPKLLAPVIEALLNGKTITLNAKVTLKSGKACSGKATATTAFGTTTYRTTLKLTKVGKSCVGTGTIKLKKSPSTRTKLKVTVSAKTISTRTLTTKRS